jgi:hypothetical protein
VADPQPAATYPATDEYSAPSRSFTGDASGRAAHLRGVNSAGAAWWHSHPGGHGGHGFGGFGGHGFGRR